MVKKSSKYMKIYEVKFIVYQGIFYPCDTMIHLHEFFVKIYMFMPRLLSEVCYFYYFQFVILAVNLT